jgi:flavin-dependent dehydrogenase
MTRSFDYDVAVVGASIAGCTAATLFARAGLRVALMLGWTAVDLLGQDGAVHGLKIRDRSGRPRGIRTRLVVGADGNHSRPAELAGAKTATRPNNRFGYFAYYRDLPLASGTRSQMWLAGWDVAYAFPNNDGLTVLACMPVKERLPDFQRDLEGSFAAFFAALPDTPPIAQGARASKLMGIVDYPLYERPVAPRPGLAPARDAALTSDPLGASAAAGPFSLRSGWSRTPRRRSLTATQTQSPRAWLATGVATARSFAGTSSSSLILRECATSTRSSGSCSRPLRATRGWPSTSTPSLRA